MQAGRLVAELELRIAREQILVAVADGQSAQWQREHLRLLEAAYWDLIRYREKVEAELGAGRH
jgi:hypothetical protein